MSSHKYGRREKCRLLDFSRGGGGGKNADGISISLGKSQAEVKIQMLLLLATLVHDGRSYG